MINVIITRRDATTLEVNTGTAKQLYKFDSMAQARKFVAKSREALRKNKQVESIKVV